MISVVIAAHDEESVLPRCLRALLDAAGPGEFEVFVVANGCTDRTAAQQLAQADRCSVGEPVGSPGSSERGSSGWASAM